MEKEPSKPLNRIKIVLAEKNKPNKYLADNLGVAPTTVSKWVTNSCQPTMETFMKIAKLLDVDLSELVRLDEVSITEKGTTFLSSNRH